MTNQTPFTCSKCGANTFNAINLLDVSLTGKLERDNSNDDRDVEYVSFLYCNDNGYLCHTCIKDIAEKIENTILDQYPQLSGGITLQITNR